jgi:hypothetical protein
VETISKAVLRAGDLGKPLPDIYPVLAGHSVRFRRGGTSMVAGPPGAYKSTLALNMMCKWAMEGLSGIYISADSDQFTVAKRCAGILTGDSVSTVEKTIRSGGYSDSLRTLSNVHWEFKGLDVRGIDDRVKAFQQMYGCFPDVIVLDNLMNCVAGPGDWNGQITMCRDLDEMARSSYSHVMILHHTQEHPPSKGQAAILPPPRWEIQGKVAQFPRLILTMNCAMEHMMVACVKNTNGPQHPDGKTYSDFLVNTENCRVAEMRS